jgi:hypothetical protein
VGEAETKLRDSEQRTSCLQQCLRPFIKRAEINKAKAIRVRFEKSENLGLELVPASKERLLSLLEAIEQGSCATSELANSYLDEAARIVRGAEVRVVPVWCVSQFCYFGVVVRTAGIISKVNAAVFCFPAPVGDAGVGVPLWRRRFCVIVVSRRLIFIYDHRCVLPCGYLCCLLQATRSLKVATPQRCGRALV